MKDFECECPYCGGLAQCETVHNGVGIQQCGHFICSGCWSTEMNPKTQGDINNLHGTQGELFFGWWLHPDYPDQDLPNRKMKEWKEEYRLQQERYYSNRLSKVE